MACNTDNSYHLALNSMFHSFHSPICEVYVRMMTETRIPNQICAYPGAIDRPVLPKSSTGPPGEARLWHNPAMQTPEIWEQLVSARQAYDESVSATYDEVLHEVSGRIAASGTVSKSDIGVLLFWKRLRADTPWVRALLSMSDHDVRRRTGEAVDAVRDETLTLPEAAGKGRSALTPLPGFGQGDALDDLDEQRKAAHPADKAHVADRRKTLLDRLSSGITETEIGRFPGYMAIVKYAAVAAYKNGAGDTALDSDDVERLWRASAGSAHGKRWPSFTLQTVRKGAPVAPHTFATEQFPDPAAITRILQLADKIVSYGVLRFADYSGYEPQLTQMLAEATKRLTAVIPKL